MTQEHAEKVLAFIESQCKAKVEKAINETLGVKVNLQFEIAEYNTKYSSNIYIKAIDTLNDVDNKMRCNPILKQLFANTNLRIQIGANEPNEEMGVYFNIGVSYKHNFQGGGNGHDLMGYYITEKAEQILK